MKKYPALFLDLKDGSYNYIIYRGDTKILEFWQDKCKAVYKESQIIQLRDFLNTIKPIN